MIGKKALGFVVAAAVVGMLAGGHQFAAEGKKDSGKTVKCSGVNSCKGKGWTKVKTEKECTDKGGTVVKEESKG